MVALAEHRIECAADEISIRMWNLKADWLRHWMIFRDPDQARLEESQQPGVLKTTLIYQNKPIASISFKLREDNGALLVQGEDLTA